MAEKLVFFFGDGTADGDSSMKQLLGGKGANLAEMTLLGVPVPPGFTISCDTCNVYFHAGGELPDGLEAQVRDNTAKVEQVVGKIFGDAANPLLFSVRSGAPISMPGMMDTVLNLGLNDATVAALADSSGNPRFVWDSYRRLLAMYGDVVMGMKPESKDDHDPFEEILKAKRLLNELMAQHTGRDVDQIEAETERDRYLTPTEALEYGIIDEILINEKPDK